MKRVLDITFRHEVLSADTPVLVQFTAPWCQPCKALTKMLCALEPKYIDAVKFVSVDITEAFSAAASFGIMTVPTLVMFDQGVPKGALVGITDPKRIEELING